MDADLTDAVIELVNLYYNDKEKLNHFFNEQDLTPDSQMMRQKAKGIVESAQDKEAAIKMLKKYLQ